MPGGGAHFSGIHQLTPERTLVLLNGRRMVHTIRDSLGLGVDMQSFPINMIDSIEVLADGASAIYGSDAVAGVINVKTRRFEGIELNAGAGFPDNPGGDSYNAGIIAGLSGARGHVTLAATIVDTGKVDFQQRDWSKVPILGHLASALTGELWSLPGGPIGLAAGLEWRHESGNVQHSAIVRAGHSGGNFAEPTEGDFSVWELFAEFHAPLITDRQFARELSLEAAVRYSDYNTVGSEATYKLALHWAPANSLHFRGVFATGFRAPNILESYGGTSDTFPTVADPCNTAADLYQDSATIRANCADQGIPANYVQNASQLKISAGGNPGLKPETSDSFSAGLVWTPEEIDNLSLSIDYYDVQVDDAINTPDPVDVILTCYNTPGLAAPECARISRGPSGTIIRFDLLNENLARLETSGIDLSAGYTLSTDFGDVSFAGNVNWLNEYVETTDAGVVSDRTDMVAGNVSDWAGYPEWRSNLSMTFSRNNRAVGGS